MKWFSCSWSLFRPWQLDTLAPETIRILFGQMAMSCSCCKATAGCVPWPGKLLGRTVPWSIIVENIWFVMVDTTGGPFSFHHQKLEFQEVHTSSGASAKSESVREDIEGSFGILKKRSRFLKNYNNLHKQSHVDAAFTVLHGHCYTTCCCR